MTITDQILLTLVAFPIGLLGLIGITFPFFGSLKEPDSGSSFIVGWFLFFSYIWGILKLWGF